VFSLKHIFHGYFFEAPARIALFDPTKKQKDEPQKKPSISYFLIIISKIWVKCLIKGHKYKEAFKSFEIR